MNMQSYAKMSEEDLRKRIITELKGMDIAELHDMCRIIDFYKADTHGYKKPELTAKQSTIPSLED